MLARGRQVGEWGVNAKAYTVSSVAMEGSGIRWG